MRRIYSLFLVALLTLVGFSANAVNVTVNVDDPERVSVSVNYTEQTVEAGENNLVVAEYTSLQIKAKDGYFLSKVTKKGIDQYISSLTYCNVYINTSDEDEGAIIKVTSTSADEARDGYCTIKVLDDASNVQVQRSGTYTTIDLAVGENIVKYSSNMELPLMIAPKQYGTQLYNVTLNGTGSVTKQGSNWRVSPATGDVIEITANFPDIDFPVHFSFANEESAQAISGVTVDGVSVDNYAAADFAVKAGKTIAIAFNANDYSIDKFTVNGTTTSVYGSYEQVISAETTFGVTAHKYGSIKAKLNLDNASNVVVYKGYSYNNVIYEGLHDGDNEIELPETGAMIAIKAVSGSFINSVTSVVGDAEPVSYTADYNNSYNVTISEGMVITVESGIIQRDKKAIVYVDDKTAADYHFNFERHDRSQVDLQSGYNVVEFYDADNPFAFAWYGSQLVSNVYLNGVLYGPMYDGGTSYEASFADGDVLKVYLTCVPATYNLSIAADGDVDTSKLAVLLDHITAVDQLDAYSNSVLQGTEVLITTDEDYNVTVKANGEVVEPQADGSVIVAVNADTNITLHNASEGVGSIVADDNAEKVVYNLQGIRVNSDKLPAGIYIVNGKKVVVR